MKCAVITPIGPGHEALFEQCQLSIQSAIAQSKGPFDDISSLPIDDTKGEFGRSHCRNIAVKQAYKQGYDWLFFLDADDLLIPAAFENVGTYIENYDAIWGVIAELIPGDPNAKLRLPQLFTIDSIEDILCFDPYITLQMGHFVKTEIALKNPFEESMDTGEDFDFYLKEWSQYSCIKIDKPFFVNRRGLTSQGPRSATGQDWRYQVCSILQKYIEERGITDEEKEKIRKSTTHRFIDYAKQHNLLSQCDPKKCAAYFPAP